MRSWPLPLQARYIVFTCAVLVAVVLVFEFVVGHHSIFLEIPLVVFIALVAYVTVTKSDIQDASHAEYLHLHPEPHVMELATEPE